MTVSPMYYHYDELGEPCGGVHLDVCGTGVDIQYFHHHRDGVDLVFVNHPCFIENAENIYGGSVMDVAWRGALLSQAAIAIVAHFEASAASDDARAWLEVAEPFDWSRQFFTKDGLHEAAWRISALIAATSSPNAVRMAVSRASDASSAAMRREQAAAHESSALAIAEHHTVTAVRRDSMVPRRGGMSISFRTQPASRGKLAVDVRRRN